MTADEAGRETRLIELHGRTIVVRKLTDAQMMLLARGSRLLQRDDLEREAKMASVVRMFDILTSVVKDEGDREYMEDLMAKGDLDLGELTVFVTAFTEDQEEKPKVRRGRPSVRSAKA